MKNKKQAVCKILILLDGFNQTKNKNTIDKIKNILESENCPCEIIFDDLKKIKATDEYGEENTILMKPQKWNL